MPRACLLCLARIPLGLRCSTDEGPGVLSVKARDLSASLARACGSVVVGTVFVSPVLC